MAPLIAAVLLVWALAYPWPAFGYVAHEPVGFSSATDDIESLVQALDGWVQTYAGRGPYELATLAALLGCAVCALVLTMGLYWWSGYALFAFLAIAHVFFAALVAFTWVGAGLSAASVDSSILHPAVAPLSLGFAISYLWFHALAFQDPKDRSWLRYLPVTLTGVLFGSTLLVAFILPVKSTRLVLDLAWLACAATIFYSWMAWRQHVRHSSLMLYAHLAFLFALQVHGIPSLGWTAPSVGELGWTSLLLGSFLVHAFLSTLVIADQWMRPSEDSLTADQGGMENEVQRQLEELREASENSDRVAALQRDFLATMSHELRTPLASMIGLCRMLSGDPDLPASTMRDMGTIERLGVQLLRMVDDGLAYVRQRGEDVSTSAAPVNMRNLLRDMESVARWLSQQQSNRFRMLRVQDIPSTLLFDERRMRQILINLISNAGRYCKNGEISLDVQFLQGASQHELQWTVIDTGRGMEPNQLKRMFEPFVKSRDSQGLGLGLAVVKRLIGELGGSLKATSQPDLGSHFVVNIPVSRIAKDFVDTEPSGRVDVEQFDFQHSLPLGLLQPHELRNLQLDRLRTLVKLGQVTDIEEWVQEVLGRESLSREATRFARKVGDAIREVDLNLIASYIDQFDSPPSIV